MFTSVDLRLVFILRGIARVDVICPRCNKPGTLFIDLLNHFERCSYEIHHGRRSCRVSLRSHPDLFEAVDELVKRLNPQLYHDALRRIKGELERIEKY